MGRLNVHIAGLIVILVCLLKIPAPDALVTYSFALRVGVWLALIFWVGKSDLWAGMFLGLTLASVLLFNGKAVALNQFKPLAVWALFLIYYVKDPENIVKIYIPAVLVAHVALMLLQVFHGDPWSYDVLTGGPLRIPCGLVADINASSALVAILAPSMFGFKKWRRLLWIIPIAGLVLAKSCTGMVALGVSYIAYMLFLGKKREALISSGVCAAGAMLFILFVDSPTISVRVQIIIATFYQHWHSILVGVGIGNYAVRLPELIEHYAHNELVHYTTEMGFIVPILFMGWVLTVFKKGNAIARAGIVSSVTASMFYFTMHNPLIAFVIVTWAALGKKQ